MRKVLLQLSLAIPLAIAISALAYAAGVDAQSTDYRSEASVIKQSFGYPDATAAPAVVAASTSTARTATDFNRLWDEVELFCTADAHFKFGDSTVVAATTDKPLPAKETRTYSNAQNARVAFILDTGTGNCWATPVR